MKKSGMLFILFVLSCVSVVAQEKLPTIKAYSKIVQVEDISNSNDFYWTISPAVSPDIYRTSLKNKKVVFRTDVDSIAIRVKKGMEFNFIILLNDSIEALTQIKYVDPVPTFVEILKKGKKYNVKENRELPKFTYQDSDDEYFVRLKDKFNLDSIAGEGNQISQILNILNWLHCLIPHDGQNGNPDVRNAIDMIELCKREQRGLNCRGLAIALNECYLAMGFKSRYVTCLPKNEDGQDMDCHVINTVYCDDLDKWIWVDPTHDAYVMDEKGELLGVEEVRDRLINNKPLILNPSANWNRENSTLKKFYLDIYMAKNLYMLECPVVSQHNAETWSPDKTVEYICLMPLDYKEQTPTVEVREFDDNYKIVTYKTNNPNIFWQKPQACK